MSFATRMRDNVAKKLIDKYGDTANLIEVQQGIYNPATGKTSDIEVPHPCKAYVRPFDQSLVVAGVVNMDDIQILMYAEDALFPTSDWKIEVAGVRLNIVAVMRKTTAQDTMITYELQARK